MTLPCLTRRAWLGSTALALAGCGVPSITAVPPRLRLIGHTTLPHRLNFRDTIVGGLSAIDFDPASGAWIALCDERAERDPARFYTLAVTLLPDALRVQPTGVVALRQANGQPYGRRQVDPEAARLLPGGNLLWTSEGDVTLGLPPSMHESRPDGSLVRDIAMPAHLRVDGGAGPGPRNNLTLEGLALTPGRRGAWAAMEGPLQQDGPEPSVAAAGGPCRFTHFDLASGKATRQIAYVPDAIPAAPIPPGAYADNGVSEILMDGEHHLLVLERAFMMGRGVSLRLYRIDLREASDTLASPQLLRGRFRAPRKTLLADFAQLGLPRLDNTEGMCWGPRLANGSRSLVFVSDDNFNPMQVTQFVACEYLE
ncbi:esterase-like activity of phytase family protein [Ramlibacter sp.]|uniref:esterase-like activity of phytase family protein n=1 Tax=Ramlibacter sp. TaxID=1917967 RepID=UPI003D0AE9B2